MTWTDLVVDGALPLAGAFVLVGLGAAGVYWLGNQMIPGAGKVALVGYVASWLVGKIVDRVIKEYFLV